ncbi:MAG: OmpH family outer membrane protein [Ferruginibacter sp.]
MKKLILAAVLVLGFGIFNASAQTKIGYINTEELMGSMPEAQKADTDLKEYEASLVQQGEDMKKEFDDKVTGFNTDSIKWTPSMKDIKRKELSDLYQRLQGWNQQAQDMYQAQANKAGVPIRQKALEAIQAVAKENGYGYVFEINSLLVYPPSDNIIGLVKKKLNIRDTPAPGGTTAPAQKPAATTPKKG